MSANLRSTEAGRFYAEVCGWLDEFFADERVWKAVQAVASRSSNCRRVQVVKIIDAMDGEDRTIAYLQQLARSKTWVKRIGIATPPWLSGSHFGHGSGRKYIINRAGDSLT